jgi:glycosyltransferase involved in cell wall biosynthesis
MDRPLASIIMAVKDGERFLPAAIASVLEQDYRPFEIIVIDGQSADNTAQIAQSFEQVRYVSQVGRGVADAYNVGIDAARGDFVAFLSHDDVWTPDKLTVQMSYMLEHPDVLYTIARVRFFLEPGCSIPPGFRSELLEGDHVGRIMETLVARKVVFDLVGRFSTDFASAEDVDWFARAADAGVQMAVIPKVLLSKRIHDRNISLDASLNTSLLLKALRRSVSRKRQLGSMQEHG